MKIWVVLLAVFALTGCSADLYHGLSETQANDMIVALDEAGIAASKSTDPSGEGFIIRVASGEKSDAWRTLQQRGLPRPKPQGFGSFYPSDGLVPSAGEERVLLQYATAQELRAGLLTMGGVVDAHVNLVLPHRPRVRLGNQPVERPRASVVVKHAAGKPPVTVKAVQSLIAGGVEGMTPDDVTVVLSAVAASPSGEPRYSQVGPISVAPSNSFAMQSLFGGLILLIMVLAGAVVFLVVRR